MSIIKSPRPSSNQSPEGFSWNIRVSENVLVTLFIVGCSFSSGFAHGQAQATFRSRELPPPQSTTILSPPTQPSTPNSAYHGPSS